MIIDTKLLADEIVSQEAYIERLKAAQRKLAEQKLFSLIKDYPNASVAFKVQPIDRKEYYTFRLIIKRTDLVVDKGQAPFIDFSGNVGFDAKGSMWFTVLNFHDTPIISETANLNDTIEYDISEKDYAVLKKKHFKEKELEFFADLINSLQGVILGVTTEEYKPIVHFTGFAAYGWPYHYHAGVMKNISKYVQKLEIMKETKR